MIIIKSINKLKKELYLKKNVGFVPTMGSLHGGHVSLIKKSKKMCEKTVVSIFVNPKQFNNKKDFIKYPRNVDTDVKILSKHKVDYILLPSFQDLYSNNKYSKQKLKEKDIVMCAKYRKGHFEGVLAVINQYLKKLKFDYIFLGEKDFQQLHLIKKFMKNRFKTNVVACKTIRDKSFLPYSSRNKLLNKNCINKARKVSKILKQYYLSIKKNFKNHSKKNMVENYVKKYTDKIEYFDIRNKKNLSIKYNKTNFKIFIAYYLDGVRLIDNY